MSDIDDAPTIRFSVTTYLPFSAGSDRAVVDSEAAALKIAKSRLGPNITQVTIDPIFAAISARTALAVRHLTWKHGEVRDSGWRAWLNDRFIGECGPASLTQRAADEKTTP